MAGPKRSHWSESDERDEPGRGGRPAEGQVGGELLHLVDRHVVGDVDRLVEAGGQLDRRVHGERPADVATQPRALQQGRRLDGAAADDDVAEVDRGRPAVGGGRLGPEGPAAVDDQPVHAVPGQHPSAGRLGLGEVGLRHAPPPPRSGVGPVGVVHPTGDLVVPPAERRRAAAQCLAGRRLFAGHGLDGQHLLDLVADPVELVGVEVDQPAVAAPAVEDLFRRPAVEPAVDLGAAARAAALGVGDRGQADGRGDAAGPVLPVHLLEGERRDVTLADERTLLQHDDVEPGLGQDRRGRRAARPGAHDEDVGRQPGGVPRRFARRGAHGRSSPPSPTSGRPVGSVRGQVSQT